MSDYFIAIGGTGARVTESLIHLCDCGFFKSQVLKVLIVDADDKNGNKTSSEDLIKSYRLCKGHYGLNDSDLFKTQIESVFSIGGINHETFTVSPVSSGTGDFSILNDLVKKGEESRSAVNLMKALYSEEDYKRDIKGGFYAHPSVGSMMFERWLESDDSHINEMIQEINSDAGKGHVNIFIVASSFGGTGASGFPAIAKKIREDFVLKNFQDRIHIAGCFMLPYFSVLNVSSDKTIDFSSFNESAKNTLTFYTEHNSANVFDRIYVLANPDNIIRGTYAQVGASQKNWPHATELLAALAADDFFQDKNKGVYNDKTEPSWLGIKSGSENTLGLQWRDFPRGDDLRTSLYKFLLFNLLYVPCVCKRLLDVKSADNERVTFEYVSGKELRWRAVKGPNFGSFGLAKSNKWSPDAEANINLFTDLYHYLNRHIEWIYRLISEYNGNNRILSNLLGDNEQGRTALSRRYVLSQLKETASVKAKYYELCKFDINVALFAKVFTNDGIDGIDKIDTLVDQIEKPGNSSIEETVKSIIQKLYGFSSDVVKGVMN